MTSEWPQRTVSELERAGVLLVQDGNHGENRPRRHELVDDGTPHIRAADIGDTGAIDFEGAQRINDVALARIRKGVGAPGDVLLTHKGTVGRVGRAPANAPHFVCSPQTTFWRSLDPEQLDQAYLHIYLRSPAFREQLAARMNESDMAPYVSLTAQRSFTVVMPPIEVQRLIGRALSALDNKVASNHRLIGLLDETVAAMYDGMRAPTSAGDYRPDAGVVPDGWKEMRLGDLGVVRGGGTPSSKVPEYWEPAEVTWVTPKDMTALDAPVIRDSARKISLLGVEKSSAKVLPPGTVLYTSRATLGHAAIAVTELATNQGFITVEPAARYSSEFVLMTLRARNGAIIAQANGSTFLEVNKTNFKSVPFSDPPEDLRRQFAEVARPMFEQITALDNEARLLARTRDLLLPRLLSGQVRVSADGETETGFRIAETSA